MTSTDNKFALLASLTSLPGDSPPSDDDDILPSLAVEPGPVSVSIPIESSITSNQELFHSAAGNSTSQTNMNSSALLSSSGLLPQEFGGASGLFDEIDEEEEAAQQEEHRKKLEEEQRTRIEEQLRKEKEAAEEAKIILLREEHARFEAEKAQAAADDEARKRQQLQEQQQQHASYMNSGSVMGNMQDLNLNDDPRVQPQLHQNGGGSVNAGPVYSNLKHVQDQYSNVQGSQNGVQPAHNQYLNVHEQYSNGNYPKPLQGQNGNQYSNVNIQQQNSNMLSPHPVQNGFHSAHVQTSEINEMPQPQPQPLQRQTTQEAGYGAASYVYSTAGNVQNVYQHPNGNEHAPAPTYNAMNQGMSQSTMTPQQQQQHANSQQQQPSLMPSPNRMAPTAMAPDAGNVSYAVRSQMRQNGINPMSNHPAQQQYMNGMPPMNPTAASNAQPFVPTYNPANFQPQYGPISVCDPILVQSPGVFAGPPHWTYAIVVRDEKKIPGQEEFSAVVSNVRRRFRHFVALEERLRADCPGAILPPRPDKHTTRAIDEASTRQSAQFAVQRANELSTYLNAIRLHPIAGASQCLKLFLNLQDHLGIAWPEVSSSIVTRLTQAGTNTAVKVAEGTSAVIAELNSENQIMSGEDNSELLAMASSEGLRISGVLQSVPKIENGIVLYVEYSQRLTNSGMEMQKLVNSVLALEKQYSAPFEVLSSGLLRCGRRTARLAVELGAAAQAFTLQHKLCRYERLAFSDRRSALVRRRDARKEADKKAQKLVMNQHSLQSMGMFGKLDGYGRDAAMSDEVAADTVKEADEIGHVLQCEVARITKLRHDHWKMSLKVMAANMREAHAERAAIWDSCRSAFTVDSNSNAEHVNWSNSTQDGMEVQEGNP